MTYFNKNKTIGSVESFTGGKFSSSIVAIPNASKIFKGSLVLYNTKLKEKFGIEIKNGVINKETALRMSQVGREILEVDICVSFTGNAGPKSMEGKPVGLVYIAINEDVYELNFLGDRKEIQEQAIKFVKNKLKIPDVF